MHTVSQLIENKKHWNEGDHGTHRIERVHTIAQSATVLDAALLMNENHVGSLVVVDTLGEIVGIFTERDILTRVVVTQRCPMGTLVGDVMTREIVHCQPSCSLCDVRQMMTQRRIRHLPVIHKDELIGMISIGDLNAASNADLSIEVEAMREYITSS